MIWLCHKGHIGNYKQYVDLEQDSSIISKHQW